MIARGNAYNRYLGAAVHQSAFCSPGLWAREFYDNEIVAGRTCHARLRTLPNRWAGIFWHCLTRAVHEDGATQPANRGRCGPAGAPAA